MDLLPITNNTKEFTVINELSIGLSDPHFFQDEAAVTGDFSILLALCTRPLFKSTPVAFIVHATPALDFFLNNCPRQFSMTSVLVQKIMFSPDDSAQLKFKLTCVAWHWEGPL